MAIQSKHVHFPDSPVTRAYSPRPRTPSPTWSDSSLPDDGSGPSTPPSTPGFAATSLPKISEYEKPSAVPHPLLDFDQYAQSTQLTWDMTLPPSSARQHKGRKGKGKEAFSISPIDLASPATYPSSTYMEIHILPYWKPIRLSRGSPSISSSSPDQPYTVRDVLHSIHQYLHQRIRKHEYDAAPLQLQQGMSRSFWNRVDEAERREGRNEADRIKQDGVLRVDILEGHTQFNSLRPLTRDGYTWQVLFAPSA